ncbi:hypothetical protein HBI54_176650 [Parastagonospora nodorum]|nr:hypothetical protein HBI54_176650 [Parastagonospora nodorum]
MATLYSLTSDGFEQQFATNHLAHFLLFQLLKDAMLARATPQYLSRYVSVTSLAAHIFGLGVHVGDYHYDATEYSPWDAYAQSKTANIWIANAIERHFGARNLHATSVHPGGITENSGLTKHVPEVELAALSSDEALVCTFKSSAQGAATQVYAAVSKEWASKGGRYLSGMVEQGSREEVGREEGMFEYANEGYAAWCYDTDGEERLWEDSLGMAGFA